ncbi:hypothetical protein ACVIWV_007321 [Bradyrhizobium diazoefficiens]|jgi:hypothetical protein|nr:MULTISPECIES: hypothetical protein [Bradyrhizobium]MBP1061007.1 hypothetical protein [Bradyrhizobium japonicum]MBP1097640.1 hypothetical protein [Bradyrhizobium japonicum]MDK4226394.1 hypothetical protein [Bradyrhizobium diazoefficiens]WLA74180.1 hypothetical protein QIH77_02775 [Bradyrhizobium diazoefficiens]WLB38773.1 hypothetical protein QIH78_02660 [Bradyrhizobium diazoefficiens]
MTRAVVLDLDQAGAALLSHSQHVQFNVGPGGILGKVFRMAHT